MIVAVSCDSRIEVRDDPGTNVGRTERDLNTLCDSANRFKRDVGRFPDQGEGLLSLLHDPGSAIGWRGPYLHARGKPDRLLINDWFGTEYRYISISKENVQFISAGEDLLFGTSDDLIREVNTVVKNSAWSQL